MVDLTDVLTGLPGPLAVFIASMTPVGELRLGIPLGVYQYHLPWAGVLLWSLLGNLSVAVLLLWGLGWVSRLLLAFPNPAGRLLEWRAARLRTAHAARVHAYGAWALVPLVAVPLPFTGAWTGCLAAWALAIPPRRAMPVISLGVLVAGAIVAILVRLSVQFPFLQGE